MNGKGVHWEESEWGSQNRTSSLIYVSDASWVTCAMSSGTKWSYKLRSPNGGGGDRPRPFIIIAIWAGFVLPEMRKSRYKDSRQQ